MDKKLLIDPRQASKIFDWTNLKKKKNDISSFWSISSLMSPKKKKKNSIWNFLKSEWLAYRGQRYNSFSTISSLNLLQFSFFILFHFLISISHKIKGKKNFDCKFSDQFENFEWEIKFSFDKKTNFVVFES